MLQTLEQIKPDVPSLEKQGNIKSHLSLHPVSYPVSLAYNISPSVSSWYCLDIQ